MTTLEIILIGMVAVLWITGGYLTTLHDPATSIALGREPIFSTYRTIAIYSCWWMIGLSVMFTPLKKEGHNGT